MEFAAARGARGEERLEELDVGGDDQRGIPVFDGELAGRGVAVGRWLEVAVVFEEGVVAEGVAEDLGVLLDDAGKGDRVDDAAQVVADRVAQGEGERGEVCRRRSGR